MQIQIAVLSTDMNIKRFIASGLGGDNYFVAGINSLAEVDTVFKPAFRNVLIMDTDTIIVPAQNLITAATKHAACVILLGVRNATSYLIGGIKGAISKPGDDNAFARKLFLRNINDRVELFLRSQPGVGSSNPKYAAGMGDKVIAIAASTGGTDALYKVITSLPAKVPPILIVQHMPSMFTYQFAQRLNGAAKFTVKEASLQDYACPNQALVAPGDYHMKVMRKAGRLGIECVNGAKMHGVRPAADVLFESMAEVMGQNVIGVILTGMGVDGARGLSLLKRKGAKIIGQNEATCVVYGMPKAAADMGIVDYQLGIDDIANKIASLI